MRYSEEYKKEVVQEFMAGDKTIRTLSTDFNVSPNTIHAWVRQYSEECQDTTQSKEGDSIKEVRRLNQLLKEKEKEIDFLKKAAAFFAKEIG